MTALKVVFFGTPQTACPVLSALVESEHEIVGVITQPDKRRGRGKALLPTPVKLLAQDNSLEVHTPETKEELDAVVSKMNADVGVVVAYGKIVSKNVLNAFKYGCINVHYSLLPRWRGAAPVERAILSGDEVTGVTIMKMDEGLDTGPIYIQRHIDIVEDTTSQSLFETMNLMGSELLLLVLDSLESAELQDQKGVETYAKKLEKEDFYFSAASSVSDVDRKVRAGSFVKGAYTHVGDEVFRIISTVSVEKKEIDINNVGSISRDGVLTCNDGEIVIDTVQVPGKATMTFKAYANGVDQNKFPLQIIK